LQVAACKEARGADKKVNENVLIDWKRSVREILNSSANSVLSQEQQNGAIIQNSNDPKARIAPVAEQID